MQLLPRFRMLVVRTMTATRLAGIVAICLMTPAMPAMAQAASVRLGDRLVVSIHNLPYTHRQVEAYATLREALRPGEKRDAAVVTAANWREAIELFTEEMIILQEAQRLGGFQADSKLAARMQAVIVGRLKTDAVLRGTLVRLGYDEKGSLRIVDAILRVASFRRSKQRQPDASEEGRADGQDLGTPASISRSSGSSGSNGQWLEELKARAVVRHFDQAFTYILISPPPARTVHGR